MADPTPAAPAAPTAMAPEAEEITQLRAGVALVGQLRRENARLSAEREVNALGARVTPAMRRFLLPVLTQLMAAETPQVVRLSAQDGAAEADMALHEAILQVVRNAPAFEALNAGHLATEDAPAMDGRSAEVTTLHQSAGIDPKRHAALQAKYGFSGKETN